MLKDKKLFIEVSERALTEDLAIFGGEYTDSLKVESEDSIGGSLVHNLEDW